MSRAPKLRDMEELCAWVVIREGFVEGSQKDGSHSAIMWCDSKGNPTTIQISMVNRPTLTLNVADFYKHLTGSSAKSSHGFWVTLKELSAPEPDIGYVIFVAVKGDQVGIADARRAAMQHANKYTEGKTVSFARLQFPNKPHNAVWKYFANWYENYPKFLNKEPAADDADDAEGEGSSRINSATSWKKEVKAQQKAASAQKDASVKEFDATMSKLKAKHAKDTADLEAAHNAAFDKLREQEQQRRFAELPTPESKTAAGKVKTAIKGAITEELKAGVAPWITAFNATKNAEIAALVASYTAEREKMVASHTSSLAQLDRIINATSTNSNQSEPTPQLDPRVSKQLALYEPQLRARVEKWVSSPPDEFNRQPAISVNIDIPPQKLSEGDRVRTKRWDELMCDARCIEFYRQIKNEVQQQIEAMLPDTA